MLSLLIIATQGENCSIMGDDFWQQIYPYGVKAGETIVQVVILLSLITIIITEKHRTKGME